MKRNHAIGHCLLAVGFLAGVVQAGVTNGQFDSDLAGWNVLSQYPSGDPAGVEWTWFGYSSVGAAQFSQYDYFESADSILNQRFLVNGPGDPAYRALSFYLYPEGVSETDSFYFSLQAEYDDGGPTVVPLYTDALLWSSDMVGYPADWPGLPGVTITPETGIGYGWYHVQVDLQDGWISDTRDTYFDLTFRLESHVGDGTLSLVTLDDVALEPAIIIPAPAAIGLVVAGLGSLAVFRRRRAR